MAEIFQDYEINPKPWWERVWRVVSGSLAVHLVFIACVLYIPGLREAFNIASVFAGANYVDEDYDKTIIGDRATMINANDIFEYPPGYFNQGQVAQVEMPPVVVPTPVPVAPPPPQLPPKVIPTPVPQPSASAAASPQPSPGEDLTAGLNENMTKEEQDKRLNDIAAKNKIARPNEDTINKKPLKDWLAKAKEAKDKKEFDVSGPIEMVIEADLGPDGKLINPVITTKKGDPKLEAVVTDFVAALSDSRALGFLNGQDVKHIRLSVNLTETEVTVRVASEVDSPDRASQIAKGYSVLLLGGRIAKKGQTEEVIYKNTKVSSNGKEVTVDFTMPRKEATEILAKLPTS